MRPRGRVDAAGVTFCGTTVVRCQSIGPARMTPRMPGHPIQASRQVLERFTWIAAAILLLGSLALLGIAGEVMEGDTLRLDERILLALRVPGDPSQPADPPWL